MKLFASLAPLTVSAVGAVIALGACGNGSSSSTPTQSCDDLGSSARNEVQAAISQNASCTVDADCVDVSFSAACFDSCSRAVGRTGKSAVDAARQHANDTICQTFTQQGCTVTVPPCVPPSPPSCRSGTCQ